MPSPSAIPMAVDARWSRYYPAVTAAAKLADPWAPYCPVPIYVTMSVLALDTDRFSAAGKASELAAAYGWSKNRVVYYFDPTLAAELCAQADDLSDTDVLPAEPPTHLPYPCVYIASNGSVAGEEGFFAWVEDDTQAHRTELRALLYTGTGTVPLILHLLPGATIGECVQDTLSESLKNCGASQLDDVLREASQKTSAAMLRAIQLLLYLVSQDADIQPPPRKPRQKKSKSKSAPKKRDATEITVGVRVGAAFRAARRAESAGGTDSTDRAKPSGTGTPRAPHMRRGHWHHFWTGPKSGQRSLIVRWVAPIAVHGASGGEVTQIKVK